MARLVHASLPFALALTLAARPVSQESPSPSPDVEGGARVVRVAPAGAKLRNLPDANGRVLVDLAGATPLRVKGERAGWLEVSPPGGIPVWIYGQFLKATDEPNVLEIAGDRVNARPLPSGTAASFPVGTLGRGVRVTAIERAAPGKPLAEDWVRVWAPEDITAWVRAAETQPLPADADVAAVWAEGLSRSRSGSRPASADAERAATHVSEAAARAALAEAQALLAAAQRSSTPDLAPVRAAYERVFALEAASAETSAVENQAQADVKVLAALEEAVLQAERAKVALAAELAAERARVEAELRARSKAAAAGPAGEAPSGEVASPLFDTYGTLVRDEAGGARYWIGVASGGAERCQVVCNSGRYELAHFVGARLGLRGRFGKDAKGAPRIDAESIEVIGRP